MGLKKGGYGLIMVPVTSSYLNMLENLLYSLQHFAKVDVRREVVVIPLDQLSLEHCKNTLKEVHCTSDTVLAGRKESIGTTHSSPLQSLSCDEEEETAGVEDWFKTDLLIRALKVGRPVLLSDVDVVYFTANPLGWFVEYPLGEFILSLNPQNEFGMNFNIGMMLARPPMVPFLQHVLQFRKSDLLQQDVYNCFLKSAKETGLKIVNLPYWTNPFCQPKVSSLVGLRTVHFSCIYPGTPEEKTNYMKKSRCWFVEHTNDTSVSLF